MDEEKLDKALKELNKISLKKGYIKEFRVTGLSMRFLLYQGNLVSVKYTPAENIKAKDIVVFEREDRLISHRVISKFKKNGSFFFRTRGDFGLKPDRFFLRGEDLLGKVVLIKKKGRTINLNFRFGNLYSRLALYYTRIFLNMKKFFNAILAFPLKLKAAFAPEKIPLGNFDIDWKIYNENIRLEYWEKNLSCVYRLVGRYLKKGNIADIGFGCGISEPGEYLSRKGAGEIELLNFNDLNTDKTLDYIVISDVLTLIPYQQKRIGLLKKAGRILSREGVLFIAGLKRYHFSLPDEFLFLKWRIYSIFLKNFKLPEEGNRVREGKYKFHRFNTKRLLYEISAAGFAVIDSENNDFYFNLALKKANEEV